MHSAHSRARIVDVGHGVPVVVIPGIQGRWEWMGPAIDALRPHARVITCSLADEPSSGYPADPARGFANYVAQLLDTLSSARGGDGSVTYLATDSKGTEVRTNAPKPDAVNAVTWGVFPGSEVLQPTVVDPASFAVWKDEAFAVWREEWAALYPEGSPSRALLEQIADTWWLVSVVDNDYVEGGDLCAVFGVDATGAAVVNGAAAAAKAPAMV